jgi:adenine-specific DNA methylase
MRLIKDATTDKLRGGYYTPEPIAAFILKWAVNGNKDMDILEPSCGDGVFLKQIKNSHIKYNSITAIELDPVEANKAKSISLQNTNIINDDFYNYCNNTNDKYNLVIGNPPYIRYQYFDKEQQEQAQKIYNRAKLKYTKLSNAWVSFVVGASLLLTNKGKLAFVVPAELLQVSYAQGLREYLSTFFNKINIVSFKKLVFPTIQQEVILLLCEKNNKTTHFIEHIETGDISDLAKLNITLLKDRGKKIDFINNKWTYYFLEQNEIDFLERISSDTRLSTIGNYASVEVGITTGANDYFTVPFSTVEEYNLASYAMPMVGRSVQVPSVIFTKADWKLNQSLKVKSNLLVFPARLLLKNDTGALAYIKMGEKKGINSGYKTGIRDDWFVIPSIKLSDALFIRRNNLFPKLILNQAKAYTTDTMHRVFINKTTNKNAFIASYYNSLSLAFSEIVGRSYGGGVLELMPSETEKIILPYNIVNSELLNDINDMMRRKESIERILAFTDQKILIDNLGYSKKDVQIASNIWNKLSQRRLNRNKEK